VRGPVQQRLRSIANISLTPLLGYPDLINAMKRACLVLTDSGGIQEEAPGLGTPVLVLRETTERPEGVEAGAVKVIGTEQACIVREVATLLEDRGAYERMARVVNPYGDGRAAQRIVKALLERGALDRSRGLGSRGARRGPPPDPPTCWRARLARRSAIRVGSGREASDAASSTALTKAPASPAR
jgi:UDP-N-acetylglucosamine 2-epimerase